MTDSQDSRTVAFACGYDEGGDGVVFRYRLDGGTGEPVELGREPAPAASFLAVHPDGTHLYVANRVPGGAVTAYEIDRETAELSQVD